MNNDEQQRISTKSWSNQRSIVMSRGQLPWWSSSYDVSLECKRLGFDPSLRHWIFQSVGTHYYIWWPITGFIDLYGQSMRTRFPQRGVNATVDGCLGGLAVMMLTQNARDCGSIPRWGTEFFGPSEPTVTVNKEIHVVPWNFKFKTTTYPEIAQGVLNSTNLTNVTSFLIRLFNITLRLCVSFTQSTHI